AAQADAVREGSVDGGAEARIHLLQRAGLLDAFLPVPVGAADEIDDVHVGAGGVGRDLVAPGAVARGGGVAHGMSLLRGKFGGAERQRSLSAGCWSRASCSRSASISSLCSLITWSWAVIVPFRSATRSLSRAICARCRSILPSCLAI